MHRVQVLWESYCAVDDIPANGICMNRKRSFDLTIASPHQSYTLADIHAQTCHIWHLGDAVCFGETCSLH